MKKIIIAAATVAGLAMSGSAMAQSTSGDFSFAAGIQSGMNTPFAIQATYNLTASMPINAGVYLGQQAEKVHTMGFSIGTGYGNWTVDYRHNAQTQKDAKDIETDNILVGFRHVDGAYMIQAQTNLWSKSEQKGGSVTDPKPFSAAVVTVSHSFGDL